MMCPKHKGMCPLDCPVKMKLEASLQASRPSPREILKNYYEMQAENIEMAPNSPYIHKMRPPTRWERLIHWVRYHILG